MVLFKLFNISALALALFLLVINVNAQPVPTMRHETHLEKRFLNNLMKFFSRSRKNTPIIPARTTSRTQARNPSQGSRGASSSPSNSGAPLTARQHKLDELDKKATSLLDQAKKFNQEAKKLSTSQKAQKLPSAATSKKPDLNAHAGPSSPGSLGRSQSSASDISSQSTISQVTSSSKKNRNIAIAAGAGAAGLAAGGLIAGGTAAAIASKDFPVPSSNSTLENIKNSTDVNQINTE